MTIAHAAVGLLVAICAIIVANPFFWWTVLASFAWWAATAGWEALKSEGRIAAGHIRTAARERISQAAATPAGQRWTGRAVTAARYTGAATRGTATGLRTLRRFMRRAMPAPADSPIAIGRPAGPLRRIATATWRGGREGWKAAIVDRRIARQNGERPSRRPVPPVGQDCDGCGDEFRPARLKAVPVDTAGGPAVLNLCRICRLVTAFPGRIRGGGPYDDTDTVDGEFVDDPETPAAEAGTPALAPVTTNVMPVSEGGTPVTRAPGNPLAAASSRWLPNMAGGAQSPAIHGGGTPTHSEWMELQGRLRDGLDTLHKHYEAEMDQLARVNPGETQVQECASWLAGLVGYRVVIERLIETVDGLEGPVVEATQAIPGGVRERADTSYHNC